MRAVIFWYYKKRDVQELNEIERFHIDCIKKYELNSIFRRVDVTIAYDDENQGSRNVAHNTIDKLFTIEHTITDIENSKILGEFSCYYNQVFKKLDDEIVFYFHFKGVKSDSPEFISSRRRWIEVLYSGCFSDDTIKRIEFYPICGAHKENKDISWFTRYFWRLSKDFYYKKYPMLSKLQGTAYLDGTYQWINPKLLRQYFNDKGVDFSEIQEIDFKNIRFTHFSEYFLCSLLDARVIYSYYDMWRINLGY